MFLLVVVLEILANFIFQFFLLKIKNGNSSFGWVFLSWASYGTNWVRVLLVCLDCLWDILLRPQGASSINSTYFRKAHTYVYKVPQFRVRLSQNQATKSKNLEYEQIVIELCWDIEHSGLHHCETEGLSLQLAICLNSVTGLEGLWPGWSPGIQCPLTKL